MLEGELNSVHCHLGPGAVFGEDCMFGARQRQVTVRASSPLVVLLRAHGADLKTLLLQESDQARLPAPAAPRGLGAAQPARLGAAAAQPAAALRRCCRASERCT